LEERSLPSIAAPLPDIAMQSATEDRQGIVADFTIAGAPVTGALTFAVYRSASPTSYLTTSPIATITLPASDAIDLSQGAHHVHLAVAASALTIDPGRPYVTVVANADGSVLESDAGHDTNDVAAFRKYVLGVVTHGLELDGVFPQWVTQMATSLQQTDHYDAALGFDWAALSRVPLPGMAVAAGDLLYTEVVVAARLLVSAPGSLPGSVVDVHLIGHSRGAVVVSEAAQDLAIAATPELAGGYLKMTLLDPHPARNGNVPLFSTIGGTVGDLLAFSTILFQALATDPDVTIPENVNATEVYFQHTPSLLTLNLTETFLNLWGESSIAGATSTHDLTGIGLGHEEVHQWYQDNVIPTLGSSASPVLSAVAALADDIGAPSSTLRTRNRNR
jgi:hypothetical protein